MPLKHGLFKVPEYRVWMGMRERCTNPNNISYQRYGGRGIKVCRRWDSFQSFYDDMGKRPSAKHQIDRIDNDRDYGPGNCRWATRAQQARNNSTTRFFQYRGKRVTLPEALALSGKKLSPGTAYYRIAHGWSIKAAVETPSQKQGAQ